MSDNLERLKDKKIVAIIRGIAYEDGIQTAEALLAGGVTLLEITLNNDGALKLISECKDQYAGKLCVGAGTVLNLDMAKEAVAAGAEYIVSPNLDEKVIDYGLSAGVDVWPGTMTPTEIVRAYEAGASAVKVFPVGALGVNYVKDIRGPLGHIPMMVTGGVNVDNINDFFHAGAIAVGLGGNLVNKQLIKEKKYNDITNLAKQFLSKVKGG
ncbi:bifunctional 4-hydroxy-2-oxoglutarate aldolase/2-dehydro-3-deoxy-phosphogluconate aldolase [Alkalihalobacillus sp. LMS39]|uniref:bifunctional 4-hydroxy-2-oxoglutarate aldolase/2-dehydro-3-deoxy-phosphogluconate aldolase n=1 Tax=Alkalihalobacillus sp. LMS39 TaxID=2924032 RepID=UPI001FB3DED5|nr:bifunctional 4-hydroxy-2-oxoglutarate aldolase/2-dehydro-3-deoxy-phosphogluconate aldolase [Alkalihalobacillus sp. LMS39]UOE94943.1 bifunctional 4-hydroxy-2-oxoglutarate aldolase/2-dehydro-3-deoxy-phosphogluconate aldolase [Alkalihalobacillus sp. LMS39]